MTEPWRWVALAMLGALLVLARRRVKIWPPGRARVIVRALTGLSGGFAGGVLYILLLAPISAITDLPLDASGKGHVSYRLSLPSVSCWAL